MKAIEEIITNNKENILKLAESLKSNPELGFEEYKSSNIVKDFIQSLGLEVKGPYAGTGLRADINGYCDGPAVCLVCELDAVANKNGVTHACGHYIQTAQVMAAACALKELKNKIYGKVVLLAVPAEEFLEIEKRLSKKEKGEIKYLSGKPEMLRLGALDDVDIVAMIHAHPNTKDYKIFLEGSNLGFVAKNIKFVGKSAHGSEPFDGRNALQAATLFFAGVNANRETFRDDESIRIHPIITKGGAVVNAVPDDVRIETYVRGSSKQAIEKGCLIVDRCAKAAADMMGCNVEVETIPGYLPLKQDHLLSNIMKDVADEVLGRNMFEYNIPSVGSSDIGDLSQMMPTIQPTMGGFEGNLHGVEFKVLDDWKSSLLGGQLLAGLCLRLLENDACEAKKIISNFKPLLTKEQYFEYLDK